MCAGVHKLQFKCQPSPAADSGRNYALIGSSWTFHLPRLGESAHECSLLTHNELAGSGLAAVFMGLPGSANAKLRMHAISPPGATAPFRTACPSTSVALASQLTMP